MDELKILCTTRYRNGTLECDGEELSRSDALMLDALIANYHALAIDYPKFFKMDAVSKLALIATEPIFRKHADLIDQAREHVGIVHSSRHGSLDTDQRYWDTLRKEGLASPALFVYTLPNIAVGEITIRHRLHGPSFLLLSERPDAPKLRAACDTVMRDNGGAPVICGWSDIFAGAASATFLLIGTATGSAWNNEQLERILDE